MKNNKNKSSKIIEYGKNLNQKYPSLHPLFRILNQIFFSKPKFSGWGMKTQHQLPWLDDYDGDVFRKAKEDIKTTFKFNKKIVGIDEKNIDSLLWRHWIVTTAIRYSIKFSKSENMNFVECGVGEGFSAFFSLKEIVEQQKLSNFKMHLYDAWDSMLKEQLVKNELSNVHTYNELNIDTTKKNLKEFNEYIIYQKGYIPDTFNSISTPTKISYLHIDLNAVNPTMDSLNFFYPKLESSGVILFDDYGWDSYEDTKIAIDEFFNDKPGMLFKLPTGQALYLHKN